MQITTRDDFCQGYKEQYSRITERNQGRRGGSPRRDFEQKLTGGRRGSSVRFGGMQLRQRNGKGLEQEQAWRV